MRRVIIAGVLVAAVMFALLAAGQLIDYGVFNLRIKALNTDTHASVFGVASLPRGGRRRGGDHVASQPYGPAPLDVVRAWRARGSSGPLPRAGQLRRRDAGRAVGVRVRSSCAG